MSFRSEVKSLLILSFLSLILCLFFFGYHSLALFFRASSLLSVIKAGNSPTPISWTKFWSSYHRLLPLINLLDHILPESNQPLPTLVTAGKKLALLEPHWLSILGYGQAKHYAILLQNNTELWPTGGYLGSYAEFWLQDGLVTDWQIQDIGVPNGQIKGYVAAPDPIVKYTHQGGTPGWRLRESNWDPDFPQALPVIDWFFSQGGLAPFDGLIALNLIPVLDWLKLIGSIDLPDYSLTLTPDNFYSITQTAVETGFFDGSTQKRDFLSSVAQQLKFKLARLSSSQQLGLINSCLTQLENKQLLIAFKDQDLLSPFVATGWAGALDPINCPTPSCQADYLHLNEANLGINKTNCCLDRQVVQNLVIDQDKIKHQLILSYTNHNPATPEPPTDWGGGYKAYSRVYLPQSVQLTGFFRDQQSLDLSLVDIDQNNDKTILGFLLDIPGGSSHHYQLSYELPLADPTPTQLYFRWQKQSGIDFIPYQLSFQSDHTSAKTLTGSLLRDSTFTFPF